METDGEYVLQLVEKNMWNEITKAGYCLRVYVHVYSKIYPIIRRTFQLCVFVSSASSFACCLLLFSCPLPRQLNGLYCISINGMVTAAQCTATFLRSIVFPRI